MLLKLGRLPPFNVEETLHVLISALIDMLKPPNGNVLDPFAGTLTSATGAMIVGRKGTVIGKDSSCFLESKRFSMVKRKKLCIE